MNMNEELKTLNKMVLDKLDYYLDFCPYYSVEVISHIYHLVVNAGEEHYNIFQTTSEKEMTTYIKGMIRGAKLENKPNWQH